MWKACPHCHEYSFGERQLFSLDYFRPTECKSCGRLVRGDGLRHWLKLIGMVAGFAVGVLILSIVPSWLTPLAWTLLAVLVIVPLIVIPKPVKFEELDDTISSFTPDPNNDKVIIVSGWNEDELRGLLADFIAEDKTGSQPLEIASHLQSDNCYRLTFPSDIHHLEFTALVNYLLYPIDFGTRDRSLAVAGKATLNSSFPGIPESLFGQQAVFYVPANDQDHDVVHLHTAAGDSLAIRLLAGEGSWRRVTDARMPLEVKRLLLQA